METKELTEFKKQRAVSLAIVFLTREQDLLVNRESSGVADLVINIQVENQIGVSFYAISNLISPLDLLNDSLKLPHFQHDKYKNFLYPCCEFIFDEKNNQKYYQWICKPIVAQNGKRELVYQVTTNLQILDQSALIQIKNEVVKWYLRALV
jgi:hypothetical protein